VVQARRKRTSLCVPKPGVLQFGAGLLHGRDGGRAAFGCTGPTPPQQGKEGDDGILTDPASTQPWYRWQHHSIPCFIRPPDYSPEAIAATSSAQQGNGTAGPCAAFLCLTCRGPARLLCRARLRPAGRVLCASGWCLTEGRASWVMQVSQATAHTHTPAPVPLSTCPISQQRVGCV